MTGMILTTLVSGIIIGSLYITMALGLSIIYGVTKIFNFAHGLIAILGAYLVWWFVSKTGLGYGWCIILSVGIIFVIGLIIYWSMIFPLLKQPKWDFTTLVITLGLGIVIENFSLISFGPDTKSIPKFITGSLRWNDYSVISWHDLSTLLIVIGMLLLLKIFFMKSKQGQAIRAVAQDMEGARYIGIDIFKVFSYTFAIGISITGFSGVLLASKLFLTSSMGWAWLVKGFVIVVFAGLGSITGIFYAGMFLGISEAFISLFLGMVWVPSFWLLAFLVILLIRPEGLSKAKL
jgi:branched-chain amino acid transport system permease protein